MDPSHQFSQELRLTSNGSDRLRWVTGAFFSNLTSSWNEQSSNPESGPIRVLGCNLSRDGIDVSVGRWGLRTKSVRCS
jgi:hypothetical protein